MEVENFVIALNGEKTVDVSPALVAAYPAPGATTVYHDVVPKAVFSVPVTGIDGGTFTLADSSGARVPASVHHIGDGTWGLFPDRIFLKRGETYSVRLAAGVCDFSRNCTKKPAVWKFTVASTGEQGTGDTAIPAGFPPGQPRGLLRASTVRSAETR